MPQKAPIKIDGEQGRQSGREDGDVLYPFGATKSKHHRREQDRDPHRMGRRFDLEGERRIGSASYLRNQVAASVSRPLIDSDVEEIAPNQPLIANPIGAVVIDTAAGVGNPRLVRSLMD